MWQDSNRAAVALYEAERCSLVIAINTCVFTGRAVALYEAERCSILVTTMDTCNVIGLC